MMSDSAAEQTDTDQERRKSTGTDERLKEIRNTFAPFFFWIIGATFILITISVVAVLVIIFFYRGKDPISEAAEKALMAQTVHMSLGMILGLVAMSFGVVMNWLAIEAPFTIRARGGGGQKAELFLQSICPGIVLMIGGMILVGISLYLPIHFVTSEDGGETSIDRSKPQQKIERE
ncbi:MAG: hypothetical protein CME32_27210 [Gimesia sp.]|nr:hypothetical protein [Gimesia sp.]